MSFEQRVVQLEETNAELVKEVVRVRDAAMGLNRIHPTVTAGRQAVEDGQYFVVPGDGAYQRLYRRSGSSAQLIAEYPSRADLQDWVASLGTAAERDVGEESGNVMEVGAFGVGGTGYISYPVDDLEAPENSDVPAGFYSFNTTFSNRPHGVTGTISVLSRSASSRTNILVSSQSDPRIFIRYIEGSSIGSWVELHHTGNTGNAVTRDVTESSTDTTEGRLLKVGDGGILSENSYGKAHAFQTFEINGGFPDNSENMSWILCKRGEPGTSIQGRFVFGRSMSVTSTYRNIIADVSYQVADNGTDGGRCLISGNNSSRFLSSSIYAVNLTYCEIGGEDYVCFTARSNTTANPLRSDSFSFSGISTLPFDEGLDWVSGSEVSNIRRVESEANYSLTLDGYSLYTHRNVVGDVSQEEGTPTGAIIERGSNDDGEYVKFADGTLVQSRTVTVADDSTPQDFNYPSTFSFSSTQNERAGAFWSPTGGTLDGSGFASRRRAAFMTLVAARSNDWRVIRDSFRLNAEDWELGEFEAKLYAIWRWY